MTQKELEYRAEKYAERNYCSQALPVDFEEAFKDGAQWAAEQMFTKEDMEAAFKAGENHNFWLDKPGFSKWIDGYKEERKKK